MWTFRRNDTLTALEIGTSKVVAIIAQLSPDEAINIVGFGEAKSRGVLKGEIVDAKAAHEDIRAAIHQAEDKADLEVHQLYLAVTGQHIRSHHFRDLMRSLQLIAPFLPKMWRMSWPMQDDFIWVPPITCFMSFASISWWMRTT